jgi:hypothetical protein
MVDLGGDFTVKRVKIFNRDGDESRHLSWAKVSLIDSAGNVLKTSPDTGDTYGRTEINVDFGVTDHATTVAAWKSPSPTGEPLLSDRCKMQLKTQFDKTNDLFDKAIALVFGNKTTIGQVCSFAKGLASNTVTSQGSAALMPHTSPR